MCHGCILSYSPCAQSQGTCPFVPHCCVCCLRGLVLILRARVRCFTQLVDSSNGHWCWCYGQWRAHWCYTQAMLTGSVVDDGLALDLWWMMAWIPGSLDHWWMLLTVPCWCCACAKNCDIPSFPAELISRPVFHHDCLCRSPFPTFSWHLKLRTVLISLRVFKSFRLCVPLDFYFMLQHTSVILKWWHSF